jgi:hypothetical protein
MMRVIFVAPNTLDIIDFYLQRATKVSCLCCWVGKEVKIFLSLLISFHRKTRLSKSFFKKVIGMTPQYSDAHEPTVPLCTWYAYKNIVLNFNFLIRYL